MAPTKPLKNIAIVGISARFGDAHNAQSLWELITGTTPTFNQIKEAHFDIDAAYSPDPDAPNKSYCNQAVMMGDITQFDASFFNIMPKDADVIDPMQRLVLEESWNALEDAGMSKEVISESRGGIILGITRSEYLDLLGRHNVPVQPSTLSGNLISCIAGRVGHFLDLRGPVFSVDTACSSSLTAVNLAVDQLTAGNCDWILCGGTNLLLTEVLLVASSKAKIMAPDGVCRVFDENANGTGLGEGVGMIVLKRMEDALAANDRIYGTILATEMNCDGLTAGMSAPNKRAQIQLQHSTHDQYEISPSSLSYFEAHGTGTAVGDYIEFSAMTESFQSLSPEQNYCAVGSVKSRLGHTMGASGILGLMTVSLGLHHKQLPPLSVSKINPMLKMADSPFYINQKLKKWEASPNHPRRAGINSMGLSGTNVYMIVEEAPLRTRQDERPGYFPIVFSKKGTASGLKQMAQLLADALTDTGPQLRLSDISFTLTKGRSQFRHRVGWVVNSLDQLRETLDDYLANDRIPDLPDNCPTELIGIMTQFKSGLFVDWRPLFASHDVQIQSLPTYPFDRRRHWAPDAFPIPAPTSNTGHSRLAIAPSSLEFVIDFAPTDDLIKQHCVNEIPVIAGAIQLAIVLEVIPSLGSQFGITSFNLKKMIEVPHPIQVKLTVSATAKSEYKLVFSTPDGSVIYSTGMLTPGHTGNHPAQSIPVKSAPTVQITDISPLWDGTAIQFGPLYRSIEAIEYTPTTATSTIRINETHRNCQFGPLPFVIDAAFQSAGIFLRDSDNRVYLPGQVERLEVLAPLVGTQFSCKIQVTSKTERNISTDIVIVDATDIPIVRISGVTLIRATLKPHAAPSDWDLLEPVWKPFTPPTTQSPERVEIWTSCGDRDNDLMSFYTRVATAAQFQTELLMVCLIPDSELALAHAISGFAKSFFKENKAFKIHIITTADMMLAKTAIRSIEWSSLQTPEWVELNPESSLVQRYQPIAPHSITDVEPTISADKTYLITGGLGRLSRALAHFISDIGASVVMIGRSQLHPDLASLPPRTRYFSADVANKDQLELAINEAGPVNGIFHLAGIHRDSRFTTKSSADFFDVVSPKGSGTDLLDQLTQTHPLDFFVAFSSVTAAFGNPGQTDYALANGYMDGVILKREQLRQVGARSGKSISIGWPLWTTGGMTPPDGVIKSIESQIGARISLDTVDGLAYLNYIIKNGPILTAFLPTPWKKLNDPVISALTSNVTLHATPPLAPVPDQFQAPVLQKIQSIFIAKFNFSPDQIQANSEIDELGLDSIAVMEFIDTCHVEFGIIMDPTAFMQFKTIGDIIGYISQIKPTTLSS